MKKTALKLTPKNIYQTDSGRWVFRKKINKQAIFRTLTSRAEPTDDVPIPEEVLNEVEGIIGLLLAGFKEELKATKSRKAKVATIGQIIDAWWAWPQVKLLTRRTSKDYVNTLLKIICEVHLPEFSDIAGSPKSKRNVLSKNDLRLAAVRKLSSNILNADLISKFIAIRLERGVCYRSYEIQNESDEGDLSKKEMRRVLKSIRGTVVTARSIFATNGETGDLMDPASGAYKDLKLPDTLPEFLAKKTPKPGKSKYKAPTRMEILDLISGLPELYETHPEAYKAFKIAYGTGMRCHEILALKWEDIAEEEENYKITLAETKNGHERVNEYLGERLFRELWEMKTDKVYVIGGGKNYRKYHLGRDVAAYFRSKGWTRNQCLHELRKWFGCMLARETGDLVEVMHALGHADPQTTADYYHDKITKTHNPDFAASLPTPGLEKVA